MKRRTILTGLCLAGMLLTATAIVPAESVSEGESITEAAAAEEAKATAVEGGLTLEDLNTLNNGAEKVYSHNDRVTFVDGTCTDRPVTNVEDAAEVVDSMMALIGADTNTQFIPWRDVTDPKGNRYYIFQQMYYGTTVLGGAVKVVTDSDGNMTALVASVESEIPEAEVGGAISKEEAEQIVVDQFVEEYKVEPTVLDMFTDTVILPSVLKFSLENEDETTRFVWVVYTYNPGASVQKGTDLPYLAHYVSLAGEYLYSIPAIVPDDEAGRAGYDSSYIFEFMEPAEYTGYVDLSDGTEKEITVTVMRDKRTGMYYLGNIERKILIADCYNFLYNDGRVVLESSPDNQEWDQIGLLSLYNYCRAWDYYNEIGWTGGDGLETPILVLNNFCDDHYKGINNACYIGKVYGMQCFAASRANDLSQCLDVIGHEFTHCVTGSLMTYNSYMNDYGAINEGMSDVQGKNVAMMAGDVDTDNWIMGSESLTPVRSMSDPHDFGQPEYTWDLYYFQNVETPTDINDHGGVHMNSSLLNLISYKLISEGGMSLDEARIFWFMADCAMVPQTDYEQIAELLPWVLKAAGMEQYEDTLQAAIEETRMAQKEMPEMPDDDRAILTVTLPDTEEFDSQNWTMSYTSVNLGEMVSKATSLFTELQNGDFSSLPQELMDLLMPPEPETKEDEEGEESWLSVLGDILSIFDEEEPETEAAPEPEEVSMLINMLGKWLLNEFKDTYFSSYGSAGADGQTINMIVKPGRSIPIMMHATFAPGSDTPNQTVYAAYMNGKWYSMAINLAAINKDENVLPEESREEVSALMEEILKDALGENFENLNNIESLDDVLDLISMNIEGGTIVELSDNGLDQIKIPDPTPAEEIEYSPITPGPKSRPKVMEESITEEIDEAA